MYDEDPLSGWVVLNKMSGMYPDVVAQRRMEARATLDKITQYLDNPPPRGINYGNTQIDFWGMRGVDLPPDDLSRAQQLYIRVWETGGPGNSFAQEGLLQMIGTSQNPDSIPFWHTVFDLTRPRDTFSTRRRTLAAAALALLALEYEEPTAYAALLEATRHARPEVRLPAVQHLARAYLDAGRAFPPDVLAALNESAVNDPTFGPRFQARRALHKAEAPVPLDNPGGAYAFKVKFMWDKRTYRTIELRSEDTLEDLHLAIQQAIDWDNDHLYSFFMNGKRYDEDYTFASPMEDDRPGYTTEAVIGELGLVLKHKFMYFFDYGDSHEFEVEVVGIRPEAGPGTFPRVVDSQGKAPPQYWSGEDDEYEEEDEE